MSESLPLGVYEQLVTGRLAELLAALPPDRSANTAPPAPEELPLHLSRHLGELLHRCLHGLERSRADTGEEVGEHLARVCIELLRALDQAVGSGLARPEEYPATPPRLLLGVQADGGSELPRPLVPLGQSALLVNEPGDPSLGESLRRELASADQVDLLCAFINWNGVRLLRDVLAARTRAG
ncbi:MAG: hypothetical protein FJX77_06915, partial [Armatimonadetes bacterium]|nr:hypothetical protein [Armatimonadota bacterium]